MESFINGFTAIVTRKHRKAKFLNSENVKKRKLAPN